MEDFNNEKSKKYKVVNLYPNCSLSIGDILHQMFFTSSTTGLYTYTTNIDFPLEGYVISPKFVEKMPHLFEEIN